MYCLLVCLNLCPKKLGWHVRLEAPRIWPDRNVGCISFMATVLLTVASSWGNCLSLPIFCLSLEVALDLRRVVSFISPVRMRHAYMRLRDTARNIYCLSLLKTDKIFERIF